MSYLQKLAFLAVSLIVMTGFSSCGNVSKIRSQLLVDTPIGTKFGQVLEYCSKKKLTCAQSTKAGYLNQDTGAVVGVKSIWAVVSERKEAPLTTTTMAAYWGFDKDDNLIDIWVWKTIDAP
jgi:hypothetical protein